MANIEIQVPDIGDFDEVTVIELLVKVGEVCSKDTGRVLQSQRSNQQISKTFVKKTK